MESNAAAPATTSVRTIHASLLRIGLAAIATKFANSCAGAPSYPSDNQPSGCGTASGRRDPGDPLFAFQTHTRICVRLRACNRPLRGCEPARRNDARGAAGRDGRGDAAAQAERAPTDDRPLAPRDVALAAHDGPAEAAAGAAKAARAARREAG